MNNAWLHLVVFVTCIIALTIIIVTGHDNSPVVQQLLAGIFGGVIGGSGIGASPLLAKFIAGPAPVDSPPPNKQAGYVRPAMAGLAFLAASITVVLMTACSTLGVSHGTTTDPVAISCAASSAAIKTLMVARQAGVLSPVDQTNVNNAVAIIAPICSAPVEPSALSVEVTALNAALIKLQTSAAQYQNLPGVK